MKHDDILRQIPDYVLGLVPANQLRDVEQHLVHCSVCQKAMVRERAVEQLVRSTVDTVTRPDPVYLRNLMPSIQQNQESVLVLRGWQKQLAPALLILFLLFGGLAINRMLPASSAPAFVATAHAATATSTYTPTATTAQVVPENQQTVSEASEHALKFVAPRPAMDADQPLETPDPLPTPVAAVRRGVH
jgi:anti-sigma factor RsiW